MPFNHSLIFLPLQEDIERMESILRLLESESDFTTRADLAQELVRESSILEDTKEQALYPFLDSTGFTETVHRLRDLSEDVRSAMEPVFVAIHHTVPMDVHLYDPEGFEHDLGTLCSLLGVQLERESSELAAISRRLSPSQRDELRDRLESHRRHAVERPHPVHNPLARMFSRMIAKIERRFPDTAAQYHPGRDKLAS